MNPDGFERGFRANAHGMDLNRNFPDVRFPHRETISNSGSREPETRAVMNFTSQHNFVLSANFHGGAVVANYPYDGNQDDRDGTIDPTPDDGVFQHLALTYSLNHPVMKYSTEFHNGITNGAGWYCLYGGMQDWNYNAEGCMEITVELSNSKYPPGNSLNGHFENNKISLLAYAEQAQTGVRGTVWHNGSPVPDASIEIQGNPRKVYTDRFGCYYRLLLGGQYSITAKANGYASQTKTITIPANQLPYEQVEIDFDLE
jgi:carboxypeptidase D